jgi:hypothetical protein
MKIRVKVRGFRIRVLTLSGKGNPIGHWYISLSHFRKTKVNNEI